MLFIEAADCVSVFVGGFLYKTGWRVRFETLHMPAKSKKQQMAAGAALASKARREIESVSEGRLQTDGQFHE